MAKKSGGKGWVMTTARKAYYASKKKGKGVSNKKIKAVRKGSDNLYRLAGKAMLKGNNPLRRKLIKAGDKMASKAGLLRAIKTGMIKRK
jgi:hypothetical protein